MIRSFFRWIRVVLPPRWAIGIALVLYLIPEAWYFWWQWWVGLPGAGEELLRFRDALAGAICAGYGAFRVLAFHPALRPAYRRWLELAPWTSRKPLPLGPIHLVAQDIVVLAIVLLLLHDSQTRFVFVPAAFLGSYLVVLCLSLMLTDVWKVGYVLAFGLGLVVRLGNLPAVSLCLLAALYAVAYFGLRRSLALFPWQAPEWWEKLLAGFKPNQMEAPKSGLGWPYDHLSFNLPDRLIPRKDAVLLSLLPGWYLYAVVALIPDYNDPSPILALAFLGGSVMCVVGRIANYCAIHWPPISLWGRIWTFRWIIPGYDQVLLAPLCVLLVVVASVMTCILGAPPGIVIPLALSLELLITLNMGPTVKRWRLTGNHRIAPGGRNKTLFQQL